MKRSGVLCWCFILCGFFAVYATDAPEEKPKGAQDSEISKLVGDWSGGSICVNKEKFPACNDEQVVYHIVLASGKTKTVTITADKIVNGKPEAMGTFDAARGQPLNSSVGQLLCRSDEPREKRSDAMHILEHLFLVGEFPERAYLLSGLTLEQVTLRPDGASHSIYEELWHVVGYQQSVIEPGDPAGDFYPSAAPDHEHQWHDLVRVFLDGARAAAALGQAPERLALEVEPGLTMADELNSVAVHNAYHLGKIVALRQRIGAWPPTAASDES